jgi:hypothetical protein
MGNHHEKITQHIGDEIAFTPIDFLSPIVAALPATFGGFGALTIDHPCAGMRQLPLMLPL